MSRSGYLEWIMGRRQHWAPSMVAAALACIALVCLPVRHAQAGPKWGADYFPNIVLTTQDGVALRFYDDLLKGKAVAINLIYTSCADVCPLETARMAEVQRLLGNRVGKDIFFYSISIDPDHDTPAVLKAYAAKFGVGPGWLFLTGKKEDIKLLSRKLGLSLSSDPQNKDGHASSLMLGIEPAGQWMRNSAVDNARFLATIIRNFNGWPDSLPTRDYAQARPLDVSRAQYTFQSRCASCHSIGGGDRIGPDLQAVTQRRDRRWLTRYLREPDKVLAERDPIATSLFEKYKRVPMPNLRLGDEDIAQLIAYLDAQGKARQTGAAPQHRHHEH